MNAAYTPHEGADRWDIRAARELLTTAGHAERSDAGDGFALLCDGWDVAIARIQGSAMWRPHGARARETWDRAMDAYADAMTGAGWAVVRRNSAAVVVRAPMPDEPQTTARLRRVDVGHYEITFDGHPAIGGSLRLHLGGITAGTGGYHAHSHTGRHVTNGDLRPAVEALAHHYGLPFPVAIHP